MNLEKIWQQFDSADGLVSAYQLTNTTAIGAIAVETTGGFILIGGSSLPWNREEEESKSKPAKRSEPYPPVGV